MGRDHRPLEGPSLGLLHYLEDVLDKAVAAAEKGFFSCVDSFSRGRNGRSSSI